MPYAYDRRILYPISICESGELRFTPSLARCTWCERAVSNGFFGTFCRIRALPDAEGEHHFECGRPETCTLPDGVFRCNYA